jgi:cholecystokinin A receptor/hypocretin (orexin) receptor 2
LFLTLLQRLDAGRAAAGNGAELTAGTPPTAASPSHNGCDVTELSLEKRKALLESDTSLKEKYLLANIRTALMLFVVTLVFILAFLPSWLMAHGVVPFHALVFYFYFAYNVCNPIIYAFMNPTFRKELQELICCVKSFRQRQSFSVK